MLYTIFAGVIFGLGLALSTVYYWVLPFMFFVVVIGIGLWAVLTDKREGSQ